ncbi:MAG: hypothetical protein HDT08_04105 [Bacteroidales bacterium]|nr:hypothetical protein [Bacteroidales bacterium]MBD5242084.1 hypothetical protein [Barnesiella sp.]
MLTQYVKNTAERIISQKEQRGESPACCLLSEIMNELREDVTECFRQLHYDGEFRASATVNKIPMLLRK